MLNKSSITEEVPSCDYDELLSIEDSSLQHGKYNNRVYLMKLGDRDPESVIERAEELAQENSYSKIFAKSRESQLKLFEKRSYEIEAEVPGLYRGEEKIYFLGKYLNEKRREFNREKVQKIIEIAQKKGERRPKTMPSNNFTVRELGADDVEAMAKIYRRIFETYPFPIHDPSYLKDVLSKHVRSFGVFDGDNLIALAACEMDRENLNVEMTDFATLPEYRGKKLAYSLLQFMEEKMSEAGIKVAYTMARSLSTGMNVTFSRCQYKFAGTLKNNTNIAGRIESMNVWHKPLGA